MRAFVPRPLALAVAGFVLTFVGRSLAQDSPATSLGAAAAAEQPEEVTVRGRKTAGEYRLELERARDDIFRIFNEANEGTDTDIRCRDEQPTGSRTRRNVCRSNAENAANATAARDFLTSLFNSSGGFRTNARLGTGASVAGGSLINTNTGAAKDGEATDALGKWEAEWQRLLSANRDLYNAVVKYAEIENEYAAARGVEVAAVPDLLSGAPPAEPKGPQCEASTLTEYQQRNNIARVTGTVSISNCPAGTAGAFTVVARVRNDAGEVTPIEFKETWQRADAEDHLFEAEYPIGENVFLQSVRVRDLECTCAGAAE